MKAENTANRPSGRGEGWVAAQFALLAAIALSPRRPHALPRSLAGAAMAAGVGLGVAGSAVAALGARNLGANLTPLPHPREHGTLVDTGIYSVVRHPIYTGIILGAFGWSLVRNSLVGFSLGLVLALFFDRKAAREEQWLEAAYPGYPSYKRRVRKLVPGLY